VVAAWASVPFPALHGYSLPDTLCAYQQDVPWNLLSSCREQKVSCCFAQSVVLRGICKGGHISTSHVFEQPCNTLPLYPQFFSPLLTRQGFLLDKPPSYSSAALQSSPVLHTLLYSLYKDLRRLNMRRWASFSAGVEQADFQEALEELRTLSQCYETGFEADETEDEADSD
ncbi:MSTO1 protein, partial [Sula dactylatra]|nr:MSTO1 protein [Sula dactylatra]